MNLKALNLKWTLAFAGAAAVGVVGVVLVLTLMRGGDDHAAAQPDSTTATPLATLPAGTAEATAPPRGTVPPGATEAAGTPVAARSPYPYYPREIPTLAPGLTLTGKRPCPEGWQRVSNDALNYSICIPPDWGVLNEGTGGRSTTLTIPADTVKILSPEGFPRPVGVPLYESLQNPDMNLIFIQLSVASPNAGMACDAKPRAPLGSLPAVGCQARFDYTDWGDANYRPDGTMVGTDIVVPLPNPKPDPVDPTIRFGLHIAIVGSEKAMQVHGETISQILDTVEGQP
jgi:hypothetical protein